MASSPGSDRGRHSANLLIASDPVLVVRGKALIFGAHPYGCHRRIEFRLKARGLKLVLRLLLASRCVSVCNFDPGAEPAFDFIVTDSPGSDTYLMRLAYAKPLTIRSRSLHHRQKIDD
jgi:hypothetical protein